MLLFWLSHVQNQLFLFDSRPQQSEKQLIELVTEIWGLLPLTPALSNTLTTENMCDLPLEAFHSHRRAYYSEVREL